MSASQFPLKVGPIPQTLHLHPGEAVTCTRGGVWITSVEPDSPLYERNVRPNDLLVDLNGESIEGTRDLQKKVAAVKAGGFLRFYVGRFNPQTGEVGYFYALTR